MGKIVLHIWEREAGEGEPETVVVPLVGEDSVALKKMTEV